MRPRGKAATERARQLIGRRFRPQGRDPSLGLDCLGLAAIAYDLPAPKVPSDYKLRGHYLALLLEGLQEHFRVVPARRAQPGDMLLCAVAVDQHHLVIKTSAGFIHAHARHGVVETPGSPPWTVLAAFRRRAR